MAPPRKRQKGSTASQSTATSLSRNVSAASTHSTPPHTPPAQSRQSPRTGAGIFTPEHIKHLIANLDVERTWPQWSSLFPILTGPCSQRSDDKVTESL